MLARHAETLFWAGRYIERAEDTARMLDVTYHGLLEATPAEAERAWGGLLSAVLASTSPSPSHRGVRDRLDVSEFLVLDRDNPGSIVSAVGQARENARAVRELTLHRAVGGHQHASTSSCAPEPARRPRGPAPRALRLRAARVPDDLRRRRRDDRPRRRLALPPARLEARARREACRLLRVPLGPARRRRGFHHWVGTLQAASALGGVPAPLPRLDGPRRRGGVPAAVAHVPPVGAVLPAHGRGDLQLLEPGSAGWPVRSGSSVGSAPTSSSSTSTSSGGRPRRAPHQDPGRIRQVGTAVGLQYFRSGHELDLHSLEVLPGTGGRREARHPLPHVIHLRRRRARVAERAPGLSRRPTSSRAHQLSGHDVAGVEVSSFTTTGAPGSTRSASGSPTSRSRWWPRRRWRPARGRW